MGNFNKDRGDRDNRGGDHGGFGGGQRRPQVMHQATCSACNRSCEVPFRPTGDKPVYCKDCFAQRGGGKKEFDSRGNDRPRFDNNRRSEQSRPVGGDDTKRLFEMLNNKIDRLINSVENLAHMKFNPAIAHAPTPAKTEAVSVKAEVAPKPAKKAKEVKKPATKKAKK